MPDYTFATGISCTRTVAGACRDMRRVTSRELPPPWEGHYWSEQARAGALVLVGMGGGTCLSFVLVGGYGSPEWDYGTEDWKIEGQWAAALALTDGALYGEDVPTTEFYWTHDEPLTPIHFSDEEYAAHGSYLPEVGWDLSGGWSISLSGTFKLVGNWDYELTTEHWPIWYTYLFDRNPHGMTPRRFVCWLVPTSAVTYTVSAPGVSWSGNITYGEGEVFATQALFEAWARNAFSGVSVKANSTSWAGGDDQYSLDDYETVLTATIGGFPVDGAGISETIENAPYGRTSFDNASGEYCHELKHGLQNGEVVMNRAPATRRYSGNAQHIDMTDPAMPPEFTITESDGPTYTDPPNVDIASNIWNREITYRGWCVIAGTEFKEVYNSDYDTDLYGCGPIENLAAMDEPTFPTTWPGEHDPASPWPDNSFDDGRMLIQPTRTWFWWENAVTFTAWEDGWYIFAFDDTDWVVDPVGAADLSIVDGKLQVHIHDGQTGVSISKADQSINCYGYRRIEFLHTSDDNNPITIKLEGREYEVTGGTTPRVMIDVLRPSDHGEGSDDTQTYIGLGSFPSWGWGLREVTTIEIGGLDAGKTYTFDALKRRRVPETQGGHLDVFVFNPGSFVESIQRADDAGLNDANDPYTMFAHSNRNAVVICDGVVALELIGEYHEKGIQGDGLLGNPGYDQPATHTDRKLSDLATAIVPADSNVTMVVNETGTEWKNDDLPVVFLTAGRVFGYASVSIHAAITAAQVQLPAAIGSGETMYLNKRLRGCIGVRVVDLNGVFAPRRVKVETRHTPGGPLLSSLEFNTGYAGFGVSPALPQPQYTTPATDSETVVDLETNHPIGETAATGDSYELPDDAMRVRLWFEQLEVHASWLIEVLEDGDVIDTIPSTDIDDAWYPASPAYITVTGGLLSVRITTNGEGYDKYGFKITKLLIGTQIEGGYVHKVIVLNASGSPISDTVEVRNRNLSLLTLLVNCPGAAAGDLLIDPLRGYGFCAYVSGDNLFCSPTFDAGLTFGLSETPKSIAGINNPCLVLAQGMIREWGVIWHEPTGTVKIGWSSDGFKTIAESTLMASGYTSTRALVDPLTGIMLVAAFKTATSKIMVKRSFDGGLTFGAEIEVCDAEDSQFGLTIAPTVLHTWCIRCATPAGDPTTYWSTDNGASWQAAS